MTHLKLVTVYPVQTLPSIHRRAAYQAALCLVAEIDDHLMQGTRRFRNRAGVLLTSLDEVVRAILSDDFLMAEDEPVLLAEAA